MSDAFLLPNEALVGAGLAGLGVWAMSRSDAPLVWRELRFPATLAHEHVEALLTRIAAGHGPVVFVVDATAQSVRFRLGAAASQLGGLTSAISGIAPEVVLDEMEHHPARKTTTGARAWWPGRWPLLRVDAPEMAVAGLLGSLTGVRDGEHIQLVVRLLPAGRISAPEGGAIGELRNKLAGPLLRTEILLIVSATPEARAHQLRHVVVTGLRALNGPSSRLRVRQMSAERTERALAGAGRTRSWSLTTPKTVLSPRELVPILCLPVGAPRIAGIAYGTAPSLMPALGTPDGDTAVRMFARSNFAATKDRPLGQPIAGGLQHTAVIGPTGSGKSSLLGRLIEQDVRAGRGALVLDVKGDLVDDVLSRIPEDRHRDVVVLDPAAGGPQPGLRLFPPGGDPELSADLLLGTLSQLYADSWGIRTSSYLRLGLTTLAHAPGASLPLLPALFTDRAFRTRVLRGVRDPLLLASWQRFEALSAPDQAAQLAPALRKIEELVGRSRLRVVLGQASPRLHFGEVLARGRIVLVRLPPGLLGTPATRLLAAIVLWQFFSAVEARAALPAAKRRPFFAYLDEVAALGSLPLPLDGLLERARGLGVGLTLAPQHLGQLTPALRAAVLANVGSLVAFRSGADEATVAARELPGISSEQLQHLGRFEVALKLSRGPGDVTPTMTGRTEAMNEPCSDPAVIRGLSGERYGQTLEAVDAALVEQLGLPTTSPSSLADAESDGPIGARRRAS